MRRYIHHLNCVGPFTEFPAEELSAWRANFTPAAARRMTPPGLMLGEALKGILGEEEEAVVYATSYSESRTLEKYLDTFPTPSPAFFQTCIHPGGIEQILVQKQCRTKFLLPLAGNSNIVAQAVRSAVQFDSALLCGSEDLSEWLGTVAAASVEAFAFALRLGPDQAGAVGSISWEPEGGGEPADTLQFFNALKSRANISFSWKDAGSVSLEWR